MKLSKNKKIIYSVLIVVVILLLSYKIPTLARFKNRGLSSSNVWSGMVATKYRSGTGTSNDPYIISNGDELAFFSSQLENNNYEDTYFKITKNILLNEGMLKYENDQILYVIGNDTYYVNGTSYYDNVDFTGDAVGTINVLNSLDNFKGTLDGDYHAIYGYYNTDALFTNLNGTITSLYIENALVNSDSSNGILADTITSSSITDVVVDGYLISSPYVPGEPINNITYLSDYDNFEDIILGGFGYYAEDSTLINCISKVNINGGFIAGGILGYSVDTSIVNAYYTSSITSNISNVIGVFTGTGSIDNTYNTGVINGGLIGYVIDAELDLNNSFVATDNYLILDTTNSTITGQDNYYVTAGKGTNVTSTLATLLNLQDSNYLTGYNEFVDKTDLETNPLNVWIFKPDMYPVLYIDDIVNPNSELYVNTYMWNSYSYNLDVYKFTSNITFLITDIDNIHTTSKYYYVSNSRTPLSEAELANVVWENYSDVVVITNEGFYVIYVKLVDNNSEVTYINSDLLVLDNSESDIDITLESNTWNTETNGELYIDHAFNLDVSATDTLSGIKSIEYYLSSTVLNDISDAVWTSYTGTINVNTIGEYKLYVKVTDECDLVAYASTPLIIYDGYIESNLKPVGFNSGNSITKNSSIMFDVSYSNNRQLTLTHNLVSSINLPVNTKITMLDKTNNKAYEYTVNASTNTIALTSFTELGKSINGNYVEGSVTNESYTFIIDFSGCTISSDLSNINVYLEGSSNGNVIRPTLQRQSFSVLTSSNLNLVHTISTTYNGSITYNSDSITTIPISNNITLNGVYDTRFSDKKTGLSIKVEDSLGNTVNRNNLKNIIFKIGNTKYPIGSDNTIRINLNSNTSSVIDLLVTTYDGSTNLAAGTYYIKIYGYSSNDGIYYDNNSLTQPITIPLTVSQPVENTNYNYSFDVLLDSQNRIVDKGNTVNYTFRVLQDGIVNPNIKVSMYRKNQLTAYNQDYTLIDMQDYTASTLDEYIEGVYYVSRNASSFSPNSTYNVFNYSLNTTNLDKTCYKFVFDLYDGNIKVESISKYIIIR